MRTGKPIRDASSSACASSRRRPFEPGMVGRPKPARRRRVPSFEANRSRTWGDGPMNVRPWARTTSAKPSSSDRKPYPGWIASQPVTSAALMTAGARR